MTFPSRPGTPPPLSPTQMLISPETEEFQLVDLSRRFLDQDSFWSLPRQFLGNKVFFTFLKNKFTQHKYDVMAFASKHMCDMVCYLLLRLNLCFAGGLIRRLSEI